MFQFCRLRSPAVGISLAMAGIFVALLAPSGSRANKIPNSPGQLEMVSKDGDVLGFCALKHTDVTADISGYVARVNVKQQFHNPSTTPVEAIYTFPLPQDAAVDSMTMTIGDRVITGVIKRKEEAQAIYTAAKNAGKSAALLDQERPNIFTQSVANVMPGDDITITISYVNILKYEDSRYEFVFPMVVGPRYVPSGGYAAWGKRGEPSSPLPPGSTTNAVVKDADKISPPIAPPGQRPGHDISLTVNLDAGVPLQDITSVLHDIQVTRQGTSRATISLKDQHSIPNKDFILRYTVGGDNLQSGILTYCQSEGSGFFTLILQPPKAPAPATVSPKEMIFVIDQTGSQEGWPISKAKETINYCLDHLNPGDTFQVIAFNTEVYPCFSGPKPATAGNIRKARKFIEPLEGNGGTDILKSVEYALKLPVDPGRPRIICYMTDGYVGNDMQIIDCVQHNRGSARMFPFGVGDSVNRFLIDGMAREGRGVAEYVTLQESGKEAAERFYNRIASPLLVNVQVNWNHLPVTDVYPKNIPDVFSAQPIIHRGRYTEGAEGAITVSGLVRGKPWTQALHVQLPATDLDGSAIETLWARQKIEDLQNQDWMGAQTGNPNPSIKEQIVQVALEHRLMSQYTSFVAVEEKIRNPGGQSAKSDVPVALPEGVSPEGIVGSSASPASAAGATSSVVTNTTAIGGGGGDPYIGVHAPAGARQVVAVFPGGDVRSLVYDPLREIWSGRFDIPFGTAAGEYRVSIIVVNHDGFRRQFMLTYHNLVVSSIHARATTLKARPGESVNVSVCGAGIFRAVALTPWGDRQQLESDADNWQTRVTVPGDWKKGPCLLTVVLLDAAHNRTEITVDMDVL